MLERDKRLVSRKQLKEWIHYELMIYHRAGIRRLGLFLEITERDVLAKHQVLLRKTEYYTNKKSIWGKIYLIRLKKYQNKYALHIPLNCCECGLKIMHVGPVLMNSRVQVGKDCVFHMNTALVANGMNDDAPILGEGVVVGIGAVVLGGVYISDYTAIGANAVVNKDINETNIAIAGVPAKKISNNGRKEWQKRNMKFEQF